MKTWGNANFDDAYENNDKNKEIIGLLNKLTGLCKSDPDFYYFKARYSENNNDGITALLSMAEAEKLYEEKGDFEMVAIANNEIIRICRKFKLKPEDISQD